MSSPKLLRNRDFVRIMLASVISDLGSSFSVIACPLLVLAIGGSAAQAGAVGSATLITRTVCRLPAGQVADRVDRRVLMLCTNLARMFAVGSVPVAAAAGHLGYPQLLVMSIVEGLATALHSPAATVLLRDVVTKPQLPAALSWSQASFGTINMIGPLLGGAMYLIAPTLPFALDAGSYLIASVILLMVRTRPPASARPPDSDRRFTAGIRWLYGQPTVVRLLVFASLLNMVAAGAEVVVLVGLRRLGSSSVTIGMIMSGAGVGAVLGAVLAVRILRKLSTPTLYLTIGLVWTAGLTVLAFVSTPWVLGIVLTVLVGLSPAASIALSQLTLNQAPRHLLGRVSTAQATVSSGLASFGPGLAGLLLDHAGLSLTWVALAMFCVAATVLAMGPLPRPARNLRPTPEVAAHGEQAGAPQP